MESPSQSSFQGKVGKAYAEKKLCPPDLWVWVGGGARLAKMSMHKDFFVMASPIFDSLVRNAVKKKEAPYAVNLNMDKEVFKNIRQFLYSGHLPEDLNFEMNTKILETSFVYDIDLLKSYTIDRVAQMMTPETTAQILQMARATQCSELEGIALRMIFQNADRLLKNDDFIHSLGCYDACRILSSDSLLCSETEVFNAAYRWAQGMASRNKENPDLAALKYYFSQVAKCIRFPLMTAAELATLTVSKDVLYPEDLVKLFQFLSLPEETEVSGAVQLRTSISLEYCCNPRAFPKSKGAPAPAKPTQISPAIDKREVPSPVPFTNSKKCTIYNDAAIAGSRVKTATEAVPAKTRHSNVQNNEEDSSDEDLFFPGLRILSITDRERDTYEELVRRYAKEDQKETVSEFTFSNVTLTNNYRKMIFNNCKKVTVDVECSFFKKADSVEFSEFIAHFDPLRYILFQPKGPIPARIDYIWSLNQDILIKFNGVTFLKVSHARPGEDKNKKDILVLNYVLDSRKVMNNSKLKPSTLALSNCELSVKLIKERGKQLENLTLYRVWGDYTLEEIMKDCPNLTELVCWKYVPPKWVQGSNFSAPLCFNFSNTFAAKNKIQKLVLYLTELKFPLRCINCATSVTELVLDRCNSEINDRNARISDVFHQVFPVLKTLVIAESDCSVRKKPGNLAVPSLINCVIKKINTIKWIMVDAMKWTAESEEENVVLSDFLEKETRIQGKPKHYRLEKALDGGWGGTNMDEKVSESLDVDGGYWTDRDNMEFGWYNLGNFYDSCELYQDYFNQNDNQFPKPILSI